MFCFSFQQQHERAVVALPKFGSWDVNDPSSGESYTMIFSQARKEKQSGGSIPTPEAHSDSYAKSIHGDLQKLPKDSHHDHRRSTVRVYIFFRSFLIYSVNGFCETI